MGSALQKYMVFSVLICICKISRSKIELTMWKYQIFTNQFKNVQKTLLQVKQKYLIVLKKSDYLQDGDFLMIKVSVCKHFISKVFAE